MRNQTLVRLNFKRKKQMIKQLSTITLAAMLMACGSGSDDKPENISEGGEIENPIEVGIDVQEGYCGDTFTLNGVAAKVIDWDTNNNGCLDAEEVAAAEAFVPADPNANAVTATDFIVLGENKMHLSDLRIIGSSPASDVNDVRTANFSSGDSYSIQFSINEASKANIGNTASTLFGDPTLVLVMSNNSLFDYMDEMTDTNLATIEPVIDTETKQATYLGFGEVGILGTERAVIKADLSNLVGVESTSIYCTFENKVHSCQGQISDNSSLLGSGTFTGNLIALVCDDQGSFAHCESAASVPVRIQQ